VTLEPKFSERQNDGQAKSAEDGPPDDAAILREISNSNLEHFDVFVDLYREKLLGYIHHRINDFHQAEDLTQDVFLRAFRAAAHGEYDGRASVATWLFTIARNGVTDYLRAQAKEPVQLHNIGTAEPVAAPASHGPNQERGWEANSVLDRLPEPQREVVALKVFGGLTFSEIAKAVGCPLATVKSRMRYALLKVRELLTQDGDISHEPR